ncbi:MAG: hypothetical protein WA700_16880 [Acidobacteriaceae bacterium]
MAILGGLIGGCRSVLRERLNGNTKTVAVADGGGNLDNEPFANEI